MSKTIGVISIKGGVGKTTAISNLSAALANQFKKKVLLVDANFSAPNVGIHLGLVDPKGTVHSVLTKEHKIEEAIQDSGHGFDVLPGKLNYKGKLDVLRMKDELKKIKDKYDYILIDSSPNLNNEMLSTMMAADTLFAVTTPDYPTLSCTMHAVKVAKQRNTPISGLILNRVYNKEFELSIEEIQEAAECPVIAVLPHDIAVLEAVSKTMPAHSFAPTKDGAIEYNKLAAAICNESYKDTRFISKLKSFIIKEEPSLQEVNRNVLFDKESK